MSEKKIKNEKKKEEKDNAGYIIIGAMIGAVLFGLFIMLDFYGDTDDMINTRDLGVILCNEHNQTYSHREIIYPVVDGKSMGAVPKIYCTPEKNLVDGIVIGLGD